MYNHALYRRRRSNFVQSVPVLQAYKHGPPLTHARPPARPPRTAPAWSYHSRRDERCLRQAACFPGGDAARRGVRPAHHLRDELLVAAAFQDSRWGRSRGLLGEIVTHREKSRYVWGEGWGCGRFFRCRSLVTKRLQ